MRKLLLVAAAVVGGCATIPDGPGVLVLPGSMKSFDQFRADDGECRRYATAQIDGKGDQSTVNQRYDFAYQQCMYAKGHQVPMARGTTQRQVSSSRSSATPPPPPPPPGSPPAPPAGYRVN